jgi:hypothetical protein
MKPNQTAPLLASLAPIVAAAPPVLIVAAIGLGLYWLFSGEDDSPSPKHADTPAPAQGLADLPPRPTAPPNAAKRRIMREDLAEALAYGARSMTRQEAVAALQALGFQKTAAYKALSPDGRFRELLAVTPDGLIEWKG